jgi:CBS-domain-containing membrane protein
MAKHHFKKIPVLNGAARVVGIINRGDMIPNLSKSTFKEESVQK